MNKELLIYNIVRLYRNKGFNDNEIADKISNIMKELK